MFRSQTNRSSAMRDSEIRHDVQHALDREPGLDASAIAVAVDDGVVTLRGEVPSLFEKHEAERATLRLYGVNAVANDLVVRSPTVPHPTDTEIAQAVVDALTRNPLVPLHQVRVVVAAGWVTLSGTVQWEYQRVAAERAAAGLAGVKGVSNTILLSEPTPDDAREESLVTG
jgi:osmotically-inducible protein OsmY